MTLAGKNTSQKTMEFAVRPMEERDLLQCAETERDAFPALFQPTSFRRELNNKIARYLIATRVYENKADSVSDNPSVDGDRPLVSRLLNNIWRQRNSVWRGGQEFVVGFVGTWYMVDEAHIVAIGVRAEHRGKGIGELLLISAIEQALNLDARMVTLEVRVSNSAARNLYKKFGMTEQGVRKGYYIDNREDALIMSTSQIHSPDYSHHLNMLVQDHIHRWGRAERRLY
ncbi:ribosomal protein S18-alanine N-acetyltransferase [Dehalococcoidia bacterium]|nr:ribosomal protein S18-alanine N-acetyltransferase [Dehalococcoidia bacterium]